MSVLKEVLSELFGMFVADARLTAAILAIVAAAALLVEGTDLPPFAGGAFLLLGCIVVLFLSVRREATRRASEGPLRPVNMSQDEQDATSALYRLRDWARAIKRDVVALYLAARDPRVPRVAKVVAACVAAYALSPIDLIPDFIPVLGYLDDVILVPLGILLAVRLVPADVMAELRAEANRRAAVPTGRTGAVAIVAFWLVGAVVAAWWVIAAFAPVRS